MSLLVVPNTFTNGTGPANIIDATQMNANFTAVATAVNNIYPSQILPITTAQATFGATATGVGYRFSANDATATPLIANSFAGQSADIFRVELTSGGNKAFAIASNGVANFGGGAGVGSIDFGITATGVMTLAVPTSDRFLFTVNAVAGAAIGAAGVFAGAIDSSLHFASTVGFHIGTHGAGTSVAFEMGNGASNSTVLGCGGDTVQTIVGTVFEIDNSGVATLVTVDASGNLGITGTLHQASARKYKTNIEYVDPNEALDVVLQTKIARYDWKTEDPIAGGGHASFIAEDTPWQLSGGPGREHADAQKTASYVLAALQAVHARVEALERKTPAS